MTRMLAGAMIALLVTATLEAQSVLTGAWQAFTPGGFEVRLTLTATETTVTGTLTVGEETVTIGDGKVSKRTFTFTTTRGDRIEGFSGEITSENEITVWMDRQGRDAAQVMRRVKQ